MREYDAALKLTDSYLTACGETDSRGKSPKIPQKSRMHYFAGEALMGTGRLEEAIKQFETAVLANPADQIPYLSLARCYAKAGNLDAARQTIDRGISSCRETAELRMLAATLKPRPSISACMIVKNEEELLPDCLKSIRNWVDEIIVVDTGSTDTTVSIAESFGARVYHHAWEGDFSKARNYSLQYATKDWILIIDADERIPEDDVPVIDRMLADSPHPIVSVNVLNTYEHNKNLTVFLPSVRFFKRELGLQYGGIVHNQLVLPTEAKVFRTGVRVMHLGYGLSAEKMARKKARTIELLEKQLAANPDDPFALFNYAQILRSDSEGFSAENIPTIIASAGKAVTLSSPDNPATRHIHLMCLDQLAWAHFFDRKFDSAIEYCNRALAIKPDYLDPMLLLGHIYTQQQEFPAALQAFQRYLTAREGYNPSREAENIILLHLNSQTIAYFSMGMVSELAQDTRSAKEYYRRTLALDPDHPTVNERLGRILLAEGSYGGAQECLARHIELSSPSAELLNDLGNCSFKMGDLDSAEKHYREAVALDPDFAPLWRNLGLTFARTNRPREAADLLEKYLIAHPEPALVEILADLRLAAGSPDRAIPFYEQHLRAHPGDVAALHRLSECYLAMGHRDAALAGLRRVIRLDPHFAPAAARIRELEGHPDSPVPIPQR